MEDILNSAERRLWLYMGMIHSASGMWTWCFSEKGKLYYTSCPNEKELQQFFCIGGCMDYAMGQEEAPSHPFIMGDTLGLTWAGEYVRIKGENRLVVIGPAFYTGASMRYIEEKMQKLNLSIQMRTSCMKIMNTVPVVPMTVFMHYIKMLHFTISFEDGTNMDVSYQDLPVRNAPDTDGREREVLFDFKESDLQEALLLQCVRNGNTNYSEVFKGIKMVHTDAMQTENPQRHFSNVMIIFISQCARAAVEGGLSPMIAKEIEWKYINRVERQKSLLDLTRLNKEMLEEFIHRVNESKNSYGISKPIKECCAYVKNHFTEPLTLESIAKEIGYTEYYLARKFQKEMGVKLLDYIKEVRLEYAKVWLTTTDKSIEEISSRLQFGTRGYFSKVFKAKNGMTPAAFRNMVWNGKKGEEKLCGESGGGGDCAGADS